MLTEKDMALYELYKISKEFGHPNVSQIIPINFYESSTENIQDMLNKLRFYIKVNKCNIEILKSYLEQLQKNFFMAVEHFDLHKQKASKFQNKLNDLNKQLRNSTINLKYRNDIEPMLDKIQEIIIQKKD